MTFTVFGPPVAQGSLRAYLTRGPNPRPIITHASRQVIPWRQEIVGAAKAAGVPFIETGPVWVVIRFYLPRPKTNRATHPERRPDLDKLGRAVLDALTHVAFRDDAQVVLLVMRKSYGDWVGAKISIGTLEQGRVPLRIVGSARRYVPTGRPRGRPRKETLRQTPSFRLPPRSASHSVGGLVRSRSNPRGWIRPGS